MINKIVIAVLCLSPAAFGQAVGGGGVPGAGGGGTGNYTLGTTPLVSGTPTTSVSGLASLQNVKYLSSGSEIGAQCNAAVTALGAAGGVIQLPNSTSLTMSTTCTNIPPGISIRGYGKLSTIIKCSVVGDCFQFLQNPTTGGEIASEISNFAITGSNTGQTSMHFNGASGYTLHDLQFQPYPGVTGDTTTVCLEFDNSATGLFTERNKTYNIFLERTCTTGVLFNQNGGDSSNSFGYNDFEFSTVSQGSNYAITMTGLAYLYNGSLRIFANHNGPGGGVIQFLNGFSTDVTLGIPNERLYITAEENGSGAGVVVNVPGTGSVLRFIGDIINGAYNASGIGLQTTLNDPNNAFSLSTHVPIDPLGNYKMPAGLNVVGTLSVAGNPVAAPITGVLNLTAATSDVATVIGATSASLCTLTAANATAAANTVVPFVSAVGTNTVTVTHVVTSANGGIMNISCVNPTYQDYAGFVGTAATLLSAYNTAANKTFAVYANSGTSPTIPQLNGSGAAYLPSGTDASFGDSLDSLTPASANYKVGITCTRGASGSPTFGVYARASAAANTNYILQYPVSGTAFQLYKEVAGVATLLYTYNYTWAASATHTMVLSVNGTTLTASVDGIQTIGPITDSAVAAVGQAGLRLTGGGNVTCTNFYVQ